jgi:hypothetical protein
MIHLHWVKMEFQYQSTKEEFHGQEIKAKNIKERQIVNRLNGLIHKINILLYGWEHLDFQISKNYGESLIKILGLEIIQFNLHLITTLDNGKDQEVL